MDDWSQTRLFNLFKIFNMKKLKKRQDIVEGLVSFVLPTMNRKDDLIKCIESIKSSTYKNIEIIVADNGSTDGTFEIINKMFPEVILIRNELNLGSPVAINDCIKKSKGEFIFRLDDDEIIEKDTLIKMLKVLKSDLKIGLVSCLYFYTEEPDKIRSAGLNISLFTGKTFFYGQDEKNRGQFNGNIERYGVEGGSHLTRREMFEKIGFYDESFFLSYEDLDWCFRVRRAGYKIVVVSSAKLYHKKLGGLSEKGNSKRIYLNNRGLVLFMKKNAGWRKLFFFPFFFLMAYPYKTILLLKKRHFKSIKLLTIGVFEALFYEKVFVYDFNGKKVYY